MNLLTVGIDDIRSSISEGSISIAVFGSGYVGLPLALHLADKGARVISVDKNRTVVRNLIHGKPQLHEPGVKELLAKHLGRRITFTHDANMALEDSHAAIITVGTPVTKGGQIILTDVVAVARTIGSQLSPGKLVVLRSTVPPRTTNDVVKPVLESMSGLLAGKDFALAFAPERTVEGRALEELGLIEEIIGGTDETSTSSACNFFEAFGHSVTRVSSANVAEMAKIFDNVYRDVNIGLANELALICEALGIDVKEAIEASNRGPRTRILTPGAGVGGSCLNKDPQMLISLAKKLQVGSGILRSARTRNEEMPVHTVRLVRSALKKSGRRIRGASVSVLGIAFRRDTDDVRETVAAPVAKLLRKMGARLVAYDPLVPVSKVLSSVGNVKIASNLSQAVMSSECIVVLTDHREFENLNNDDFLTNLKDKKVFVDGRQVLDPHKIVQHGHAYTGIGRPPSAFRDP